MKHLLDRKSLILLMNAFGFSKLFYCSTVKANTSQGKAKKLQLEQNFAARIVLGLRKDDHISKVIRSLNWLTVKDRLLLSDALILFKCPNDLVPKYLASIFVPLLIFTLGLRDHTIFYTSLVVVCHMDNVHSRIVDANFGTVYLMI